MRKSSQKGVDVPTPDDIEKNVPPHSAFSEEYVLGVCMLENTAFNQIQGFLTQDMFYDPRHQKVYNAISELVSQCKPVDILMVANNLDQKGELEPIGGGKFVTYLSSKVSNSSYLMYHARLIKQKHLVRELISLCGRMRELAQEEQVDIEELIEQAEKKLFSLTLPNLSVQTITPLVQDINNRFSFGNKGMEYASDGSYVTTGYSELDDIVIGWGRSELIVVAGRPAMGKSTFVVSSAIKLAIDKAIPTLIFSIEKSAKQLATLITSNICEVSAQKLRSGKIAPYEQGVMNYKTKKLFNVPLFIDDTVGLSVGQIWKISRRMIREHGIKIIFIDYLQLLKGNKHYASRYEEVSDVIISLKKIARELDIPIVVTSQLSRSSEDKTDYLGQKPKMKELRDSGAIEEVADKVCLLYRPIFYDVKKDDHGQDMCGVLEVIIAKNHDGEEGDRLLRFRGEFNSIESLDYM